MVFVGEELLTEVTLVDGVPAGGAPDLPDDRVGA